MPADCTEALDRDFEPVHRKPAVRCCDLGSMGNAPASCAEFVERDAAQFDRQSDRASASDLIEHPGHRGLVGAHVRTEDVVALIAQRMGKGPHQFLLALRIHARVGAQHRFASAMAQPRRRIFQGHSPGQSGTLERRHIGRHAQAADRRSGRDIVDHQRCLQLQ